MVAIQQGEILISRKVSDGGMVDLKIRSTEKHDRAGVTVSA